MNSAGKIPRARIPRSLALGMTLLVATIFFPATQAQESIDAPSPLTSAAQVSGLPRKEAVKALPARIEGVVVYARLRREGALVVQDHSGAIYVRPGSNCPTEINRGDVVIIEGVTNPGRFGPIVTRASCKIIGTAPIPAAMPVTLGKLFNGQFDGQWIEAKGIVRSVSSRRNWPQDTMVELVHEEVRIPVIFHDVALAVAERWVDSKINVRGICFHFCNSKGQLFHSQIVVPTGEPWDLEEQATPDPFSLPVQSPASLLRYVRGGTNEHRVHLRGKVTYSGAGQIFFIQDGRDALEVHTREEKMPHVGDVVDVVGFTARGAYSPILEDARFRPANVQQELVPRNVDHRGAQEADGELVKLQARLVDVRWTPVEWVLLLDTGKSLLNARLPLQPGPAKQTLPWENGTVLELTGISRAIMGAPEQRQWRWEPRSLELLLRSFVDVVILKPAPWWQSARAHWTGISALVALTAGLGVVSFRSRTRVREQKLQRRAAEAEFSAVLKERGRVAREIHDTLAQGLTSISMQIEMTKEQLTTKPEAARGHLEMARTLVRDSLMEARRSIWGLRPQILEAKSLTAALSEIGDQLVSGSGITFRLNVLGEEVPLSTDMETDLLRIGQEAITNAVKHARARFITVDFIFSPGSVQLRVTDDGRGYDPSTPNAPRKDRTGFGVTGMRERAQQLKGTLALNSTAGKGTELIVNVPTG